MSEELKLIIQLLKRFEGCRLKAYQDSVGIWTIGYGETLGIKEGMVWTQKQAEDQLARRALSFMLRAVKDCPQLFLEPPERVAAYVSLAYNIGLGAIRSSSVKRYTMRQEYIRAGESFILWNKAGGRVIRGLTNRRIIEKDYYDSVN